MCLLVRLRKLTVSLLAILVVSEGGILTLGSWLWLNTQNSTPTEGLHTFTAGERGDTSYLATLHRNKTNPQELWKVGIVSQGGITLGSFRKFIMIGSNSLYRWIMWSFGFV